MDIEVWQSQEGIRLDPSVLQEQGETYSSLTDTNQIPLFTNTFEELQKKKREEEAETLGEVKTALFQNKEDHGLTEYERIQNNLFINTETQLIKEEIEEKGSQAGTAIASVAILLILFFMVALDRKSVV